jgi:hypothetical protein
MEWDALTSGQQRQVEADRAGFLPQLERVGVDLRPASEHMNEIQPPRISNVRADDESFIETFTLDVSGILVTLRQLPDGAGTRDFRHRHGRRGAARRVQKAGRGR